MINSVLEHLKKVLDTNTPESQLACICRLFQITPFNSSERLQNFLDLKEIRTDKLDINQYCDYLPESFIDETEVTKVKKEDSLPIRHGWVKTVNQFGGAARVNREEYHFDDGDLHSETNIIKAIRQMIPDHIIPKKSKRPDSYYQPESYMAESNQVTILLPFDNEFNNKDIVSDNKGWDFYHFDNQETKEYLSSKEGAISFLAALQVLDLNDSPIDNLLIQSNLKENISPFLKYKKSVLTQARLLKNNPNNDKAKFKEHIEALLSDLEVKPVRRDFDFYKKIHQSLIKQASEYMQEFDVFSSILEIEFEILEKAAGKHETNTFIKLSDLLGIGTLKGYVFTSNKSRKGFITPRFKANQKNKINFNKFNYFCSEKKTGKDRISKKEANSIRDQLSYFMCHSSGVAITLNIPSVNRDEKMGAPAIIMPHVWVKVINALRKSTTKTKLTAKDINVSEKEFDQGIKSLNEEIDNPLSDESMIGTREGKHSKAKKKITQQNKKEDEEFRLHTQQILNQDRKGVYKQGSEAVRVYPDPNPRKVIEADPTKTCWSFGRYVSKE